MLVKHTVSTTQLVGRARGRAVQVRLRRGARRFEYERFIFHVELRAELPAGPIDLALSFPAKYRATEPRVTIDRGRWLRVGFMHLGKLDVLDALDALLEAARARDADASGSDRA